MESNSDQPFIDFCGVRVFASRDGVRVRGRVEFPDGREAVAIDYRSSRADDQVAARADHDPGAARRLALLDRWDELCKLNPDTPRTTLGRRVAVEGGVSVRSLQLWRRRLDHHGPVGLRDGYTAAPPSVLTLSADRAFEGVRVAAWWAFRVGNLAVIDNKAMVAASGVLSTDGVVAADVLVAIDCYYAWPCDRRRYPFKAFDRWARHDFRTWLLRACDREDYRRAVSVLDQPAAHGEPRASARADSGCHAHPWVGMSSNPASQTSVALLAPTRVIDVDVPESSDRRRAAGNRRTRQSIRRLVTGAPEASPPATASNVESARRAKQLMGEGFTTAAREVAGRVDGGFPSLSSFTAPGTMAEALAALPDNYRSMLLAASKGDRTAFDQAVATRALWYDRMPDSTRARVAELPGLRLAHRSQDAYDRRVTELVLDDVRAFKGGGVLAAAKRLAL